MWGWMPRVRDKGRSPLSAVNAPTWRVPLPDATCALVGVTSFRGLSCQTHVGRPRRPDILPSREKERERGERNDGKRRDRRFFLVVCRKGKRGDNKHALLTWNCGISGLRPLTK